MSCKKLYIFGKILYWSQGSALSFLLTEGAFDKAEEWTQLSASQRASVKAQYAVQYSQIKLGFHFRANGTFGQAAGIKLIVSVFGETDAPTSSGADPVATANKMAAWVKQFGLDGIDVDYEVRSIALI